MDGLIAVRDDGIDPLEVNYNLARHFEGYRLENQVQLDRLYDWFALICLLVGLQVVSWGLGVV